MARTISTLPQGLVLSKSAGTSRFKAVVQDAIKGSKLIQLDEGDKFMGIVQTARWQYYNAQKYVDTKTGATYAKLVPMSGEERKGVDEQRKSIKAAITVKT